jgi:GAF domain-containing protein
MTTGAGAPTGDHRLARSIEGTLQGLATQARDAVGKAHSAGITIVEAGEVTGRCCTDRVADDLDRAQWEADEGPCIDALRFLQIFNVACVADALEWHAFRDAAAGNGIASSLAVPLFEGGRALGTLTLYSRVANGFDDCEQLAMDWASRSAVALVRAEFEGKLERP